MGKKFQDLDLSNAYLFAAAMQDEEACRLVLKTIIGKEIPKIKVHAEHTIFYSSNYKSVRLDIYAKDEVEVSYNIEMQNENKRNLAKRSRYYQAEMDITSLKPGEDYKCLKPSYIIFICTFDPFGKGRYRYVFEPYCKEADVSLNDETQRIFLNTKGKNVADIPIELLHFLQYIENSTEEVAKLNGDETVSYLHSRVQSLKRNRELEVGYMYLQEFLDDQIEAAVEAAVEEAVEKTEKEVKVKTIMEFLADTGEIPKNIENRIWQEQDAKTLSKWIKLAARVNSIEEFKAQM
ncbi:MAG: Rpn family recombination-promoting nuclease/putative transposase [Lachnospiraceae bacterium]|nr:Rpn family recombination-promoting nuclease/putative transposase [Lachnospiraceae bacterium]